MPPAYEQVTGFTVTTGSGAATTIPVSGSPGAGGSAQALITVTAPVTIAPVTVQDPGTCASVNLQQDWLSYDNPESGLGSFSVTGAIGCSLTAAVTTQTVAEGGSFTAMPGTPMTIDSQGTTITAGAAATRPPRSPVFPSGPPVRPASRRSRCPPRTPRSLANMKMECLPQPALEQSTGGTVTQLVDPEDEVRARPAHPGPRHDGSAEQA